MAARQLNLLASIGLAVGGAAGMAGTFVEPPLRGLLWTLDGSALVMASAVLTACFLRAKQDLAAAGFLAFAIGQGLVISTAGQDVVAGAPVFGAGSALWAVGLAMISTSAVFPLAVRLIGLVAAALFAITAFQIMSGAGVTALTQPLPAFAFPVLIATLIGWIWGLLRPGAAGEAAANA
ncbi:MAG TPA: hypothetical protein VG942_02900 [Hyphomonadaceae bacterium]|nr:hypothetical protein [Hyphomonadaceae bacterium]